MSQDLFSPLQWIIDISSILNNCRYIQAHDYELNDIVIVLCYWLRFPLVTTARTTLKSEPSVGVSIVIFRTTSSKYGRKAVP
jgi:hypothetical protein